MFPIKSSPVAIEGNIFSKIACACCSKLSFIRLFTSILSSRDFRIEDICNLQEKCNNLDAVDHHGKNDLRDLWDMVKPGENPTTETIEIVKGEMINA